MAKRSEGLVEHAIPVGGTMEIPLKRIIVDKDFNVRQTEDEEAIKLLLQSMEKEGQIQDVVVEPGDDGNYHLIAGFRRVAAAKLGEWQTIRATVWEPTNAKGERETDKHEAEVARLFVNLAENVARSNVSTYDLAIRCKTLKGKYDLAGDKIAKRLGRNTGYINNLLQIVGMGEKGEHAGNTLAPRILARWKEECSWSEDEVKTKICKTPVLRAWVKLDHDTQMARFNREMWVAENPSKDAGEYDKMMAAANGQTGAQAGAGSDKESIARATAGQLMKALEAAHRTKTQHKGDKEKVTWLNGVIAGLEFAVGVKRGTTNRIRGVCAFDGEGKMIEGAPPEKKEERAQA